MRQIVQNYKAGTLSVEEVPEPALKPGGVLVQTFHSLISAGTERMKVNDSKRSYLGMAKARPEKVKQVIEALKQQGLVSTYRKVMNRLDAFTPLGYSLAGQVIAVGSGTSEFRIGDMVACAGAGTANHAEMNWVPFNLCAKLPKMSLGANGAVNNLLPTDLGAFTTCGAIAMQAVRQAEVHVGELVCVIGLGLIGLISCQILKASGCIVIGIDTDPHKIGVAKKIGVDCAVAPSDGDIEHIVFSFSGGYGADAVLIATGTQSNAPIITAGKIARDRATIVNVGINKLEIPWEMYFSKDLTLKQSRSYGPGRYDPKYELDGHDYPIGYVRWTEKRNMISFMDLMASGRVTVESLITHRFTFENAPAAYELIARTSSEPYVGIILEYDALRNREKQTARAPMSCGPLNKSSKVRIGMIGAGNFARTMLLPYLKDASVDLIGVATTSGISARDAARKFGFAFCTTDYRHIIDHPEINTIMICTRHHLHAKMVLEGIKTGKHVYTEKPLCLAESDLSDIAAAFTGEAGDGEFDRQEKGVGNPALLMVGFNRRYAPLMREMKAFFSSRREPMILYYRINAGFKEKSDWYQDPAIGGSRLIGEVCHFVDALQFLTDAFPVSVFAQTILTDNQAVTPEDNVQIQMRFGDGSIGCISYLANGDSAFPKEYVEIFCESKVAVLDNFSKLTTMNRGKRKSKRMISIDKGHKNEMREMVNAITNGTHQPISFESICLTTRTCFKIKESVQKNELVHICKKMPDMKERVQKQ